MKMRLESEKKRSDIKFQSKYVTLIHSYTPNRDLISIDQIVLIDSMQRCLRRDRNQYHRPTFQTVNTTEEV